MSPAVAATAAPPNTSRLTHRTAVGLMRAGAKTSKASTEPMPPATETAIPARYAHVSRLRMPSATSPDTKPTIIRPAAKPTVSASHRTSVTPPKAMRRSRPTRPIPPRCHALA